MWAMLELLQLLDGDWLKGLQPWGVEITRRSISSGYSRRKCGHLEIWRHRSKHEIQRERERRRKIERLKLERRRESFDNWKSHPKLRKKSFLLIRNSSNRGTVTHTHTHTHMSQTCTYVSIYCMYVTSRLAVYVHCTHVSVGQRHQ